MCGIAGYLQLDAGRSIDPDLLSRMTASLVHRGPDAGGFYRKGAVGLGHRRLSIIDLAGGAQPMSNEDGTVWITFNGEIFNFLELRCELEARGHTFKTRSDTECIVHLFEEHGTRCAEKLVGQFAFAIWDERSERLYAARDHVGIKPFFYSLDAERLLFASELKAILEDESLDRTIDDEALIEYLTYQYVPAPRTIFRSVRKLPAGHWLLLERGKARIERYWEMPLAGPRHTSEEECARSLEDLLRTSVKSQLMSDVPLGAFLSGGIDSSIVVGLMAELTHRPVKTFTIGFREEEYSEVEHARKLAERHGTEHRELIVEPESLDLIPRLVRQLDEPFADASAIPTYYVSRMAREHVTVCLSGDGGDEGFAGYQRYRWALKHSGLDWLPGSWRSAAFSALGKLLSRSRYAAAARRFALDPVSRYADLIGYTGGAVLHGLLSGDLDRLARQRPDFAFIRDLYERADGADYLTRLQYIDINSYLPDDILVKSDRMSMLCSLEVRVPLLDHRILEFAARVPPKWRLGKRILKRAAARLVPQELLERRKKGFGVPLKHWFRGDWREYTRDLLLGRTARERGFLDPRGVESLLDAQLAGRAGATAGVFALVMLEEWCRQHLDQPLLRMR